MTRQTKQSAKGRSPGEDTKTAPRDETAIPERIEAREFLLKDREGNTRIRLGPTPAGEPAIQVLDPDGTRRIELGVSEQGPVFSFLDDKERLRLTANLVGGTVRFYLWGDKPGKGARIEVEEDGTGSLILAQDAKCRRGFAVKSDSDGIAVMLHDGAGRIRMGLGAPARNEQAFLVVLDRKGVRRWGAPSENPWRARWGL